MALLFAFLIGLFTGLRSLTAPAVTAWAVYFGWLQLERPLSYIGYGGEGKQVRDVLHIDDLCDLILEQLAEPARWDRATVNVGGGVSGSLSLQETTEVRFRKS